MQSPNKPYYSSQYSYTPTGNSGLQPSGNTVTNYTYPSTVSDAVSYNTFDAPSYNSYPSAALTSSSNQATYNPYPSSSQNASFSAPSYNSYPGSTTPYSYVAGTGNTGTYSTTNGTSNSYSMTSGEYTNTYGNASSYPTKVSSTMTNPTTSVAYNNTYSNTSNYLNTTSSSVVNPTIAGTYSNGYPNITNYSNTTFVSQDTTQSSPKNGKNLIPPTNDNGILRSDQKVKLATSYVATPAKSVQDQTPTSASNNKVTEENFDFTEFTSVSASKQNPTERVKATLNLDLPNFKLNLDNTLNSAQETAANTAYLTNNEARSTVESPFVEATTFTKENIELDVTASKLAKEIENLKLTLNRKEEEIKSCKSVLTERSDETSSEVTFSGEEQKNEFIMERDKLKLEVAQYKERMDNSSSKINELSNQIARIKQENEGLSKSVQAYEGTTKEKLEVSLNDLLQLLSVMKKDFAKYSFLTSDKVVEALKQVQLSADNLDKIEVVEDPDTVTENQPVSSTLTSTLTDQATISKNNDKNALMPALLIYLAVLAIILVIIGIWISGVFSGNAAQGTVQDVIKNITRTVSNVTEDL
jgi:hypothetical protein